LFQNQDWVTKFPVGSENRGGSMVAPIEKATKFVGADKAWMDDVSKLLVRHSGNAKE
jgi:hypothetical protein